MKINYGLTLFGKKFSNKSLMNSLFLTVETQLKEFGIVGWTRCRFVNVPIFLNKRGFIKIIFITFSMVNKFNDATMQLRSLVISGRIPESSIYKYPVEFRVSG